MFVGYINVSPPNFHLSGTQMPEQSASPKRGQHASLGSSIQTIPDGHGKPAIPPHMV